MMKTKTRESGIELLRIIAMLMVMFVHADFLAMGAPSSADVINNVADASVRVWIQALTMCCVDIFVLISGRGENMARKYTMRSKEEKQAIVK